MGNHKVRQRNKDSYFEQLQRQLSMNKAGLRVEQASTILEKCKMVFDDKQMEQCAAAVERLRKQLTVGQSMRGLQRVEMPVQFLTDDVVDKMKAATVLHMVEMFLIEHFSRIGLRKPDERTMYDLHCIAQYYGIGENKINDTSGDTKLLAFQRFKVHIKAQCLQRSIRYIHYIYTQCIHDIDTVYTIYIYV